jgi:hypothetical protein
MQEALQKLLHIYREYDLAGGCYLVNQDEMAFGYSLYTSWNCVIEDESVPLGFRIRAKSEELGHDRAQAMMEGTVWMLGAMRNFGRQCEQWGKDLMRLLQSSGLRITYKPFGGAKLPHLGSLGQRDQRSRGA